MLRFFTAGESHGPELVAVIEGAPAGFDIDSGRINNDLARRQKGYGRGGRMVIERDEVRIVSGIRFGRTMGSPVTFIVANRDFKNWEKRMSARSRRPRRGEGRDPAASRPCRSGRRAQVQPRRYPGHPRTGVGARDHGASRDRCVRQAIDCPVRRDGTGLCREYRCNRGPCARRSWDRGTRARLPRSHQCGLPTPKPNAR